MKASTIFGLVLVVVGILAFIYPRITYTKTEKVADIGPIEVTRQEKKHLPVGPVVGGLALVSGIVLVVIGTKRL